MNGIATAFLTAIAAYCVICAAWRMRGAVHYDDTAIEGRHVPYGKAIN